MKSYRSNLQSYVCAVLFFCTCLIVKAGWSNDGEFPWGKLTDELETPHRQLFKPLSGKIPKIFFMGYGFGLREIAEFRQRFECDSDYWATMSNTQFSAYENLSVGKRNSTGLYAVSMDENT